jgi:hypothetical protein
MKKFLIVGCLLVAPVSYGAECVTNSRGQTVCGNGANAVAVNPNTGTVTTAQKNANGVTTMQNSNGAKAAYNPKTGTATTSQRYQNGAVSAQNSNGTKAAYNPNTGNAAVQTKNANGVATTQSSRGGEAKTKNGMGVAQGPGGTTCAKGKYNAGCTK